MTKKYLREKIEVVLARNDTVGMVAVGRALIHLRNRQTEDELVSKMTKEANGRGFLPAHAEIGTDMANFFETRAFLTRKQLEFWQKPVGVHNKPRITKYWRQLSEEAVKKMEGANV